MLHFGVLICDVSEFLPNICVLVRDVHEFSVNMVMRLQHLGHVFGAFGVMRLAHFGSCAWRIFENVANLKGPESGPPAKRQRGSHCLHYRKWLLFTRQSPDSKDTSSYSARQS